MLNIIALRFVSLSEIQKVRPEIDTAWIESNPTEFEKILFGLGIDTSVPFSYQNDLPHRNFFGELVRCSRWVGNERCDKEWLNSGHASVEAKDKVRGSRLMIDLYRLKGLADVENGLFDGE